jgi:hypothetical protein
VALDLQQTQGQMFGPAGSNHAPGLVPDPGSVTHTPPLSLGDDGVFHNVGDLGAPSVVVVSSSPFTVPAAENGVVFNVTSPATATMVAPATLPSGYKFTAFCNTTKVIVEPGSGSIAVAGSGLVSAFTMTQLYATAGFVWDGSNLYLLYQNT